MDELLTFAAKHGIWLTVIAVAGVICLGILKYCGVFDKYDEQTRHYLYVGISVAISTLGGCIYMAIVGDFTVQAAAALAGSVFALNQTFYNIFKATSLNKLVVMIMDKIKEYLISKADKDDK